MLDVIRPTWRAKKKVHALCTTRIGGFSTGPYRGLNLATHVGDELHTVNENRALLQTELALPQEPRWLNQNHGTEIVAGEHVQAHTIADACHTSKSGIVCAVMTADCLPILLCDEAASMVLAIHAGWRGLYDGIIPKTLVTLGTPLSSWLAWIGPGIGPAAYQVGADLVENFNHVDPDHSAFFEYHHPAWHADLPGLAEYQLRQAGVTDVSRYRGCTFADSTRFYSYRRDGICGRMASLIWLG
jgi:polyphenol oxidase